MVLKLTFHQIHHHTLSHIALPSHIAWHDFKSHYITWRWYQWFPDSLQSHSSSRMDGVVELTFEIPDDSSAKGSRSDSDSMLRRTSSASEDSVKTVRLKHLFTSTASTESTVSHKFLHCWSMFERHVVWCDWALLNRPGRSLDPATLLRTVFTYVTVHGILMHIPTMSLCDVSLDTTIQIRACMCPLAHQSINLKSVYI